MNNVSRWAMATMAVLFSLSLTASAQEPPTAPREPASPGPVAEEAPLRELGADAGIPAVEAAVEAPAMSAVTPLPTTKARTTRASMRARNENRGNAVVIFNDDALQEKGTLADAVVSIGGSSTAKGDVLGAVVSILGDSRTEGDVGDAVVSIFGNSYVNGSADTVVSVFGGVELGPNAVVQDVVSIGGPIKRQAGSRVTGEAQEIGFISHLPDFTGFRAWIRHALFWFRPLAFGPNLGWAWAVAGTFLGLYVATALIFGRGVERCIETLETRPGRTFLAALISLFLTPVITVLLAITVIGPVFSVAIFVFATLFGKAAVLGWLGKRTVMGFGGANVRVQMPLAVLVGGVVITALYLIPLVGIVLWTLTSTMSLGVVIYTLLLGSKRRATTPAVPPKGPSTVPVPVFRPVVGPGSGYSDTPRGAADAGAVSAGFAATATDVLIDPPIMGETTLPTGPASIPSIPAVTLARAGFWIRAGALGIDVVLVGAISLFVSVGSIFLLLLAAYGAVMWKVKGTTIGGIVCGLKVVRFDDRPLDWTSSIVRALACFLSLFVVGLGFIWVVFDDEKQSWHDKIAGTIVVRTPEGTSLV